MSIPRLSRREILLAGTAAGASLIVPSVPRLARAATTPVSYNYDCVRAAAFLPNPNSHSRVGYLTDFSGLGLSTPLPRDFKVYVPWSGSPPAYSNIGATAPTGAAPGLMMTANVVGVIEKLSWLGGVGDAIQITAWVSQKNAIALSTMQQLATTNTAVSTLGYWIVDYDLPAAVWYEQAYPLSPSTLSGQVSSAPSVNLLGVSAVDGIDVTVYKVVLSIVPSFNRVSTLRFASSSKVNVVKPWGQSTIAVPTLPGPVR
jgi:hypothetical protein